MEPLLDLRPQPQPQGLRDDTKDQDGAVDFSDVTNSDDCVAVIATAPFTDNEAWLPLPVDAVTTFADGRRQDG